MKPTFRIFLLASTCFLISGCGNPHELETARVEGVVSYNGTPITKGLVVFIPAKGKRATGKIDGEGRFSLTTYSDGDGAIVGAHKVGIIAFENMDQFYLAYYSEKGSHEMPEEIIPKKYADPYSSGLKFQVQSGQRNQADFSLKKN